MSHITFLLGTLSLLFVVISVIIITISYRRFSAGEFKGILKCLLCAFYFMAVPYTLFVIQELGILQSEFINLIIYSFMILVSLCLVRASLKLNKFSKVFGFAKPEEKFIKAFVGRAKKGGKK